MCLCMCVWVSVCLSSVVGSVDSIALLSHTDTTQNTTNTTTTTSSSATACQQHQYKYIYIYIYYSVMMKMRKKRRLSDYLAIARTIASSISSRNWAPKGWEWSALLLYCSAVQLNEKQSAASRQLNWLYIYIYIYIYIHRYIIHTAVLHSCESQHRPTLAHSSWTRQTCLIVLHSQMTVVYSVCAYNINVIVCACLLLYNRYIHIIYIYIYLNHCFLGEGNTTCRRRL